LVFFLSGDARRRIIAILGGEGGDDINGRSVLFLANACSSATSCAAKLSGSWVSLSKVSSTRRTPGPAGSSSL
jgi:hypothetical protein